jgi:hypothetical protein
VAALPELEGSVNLAISAVAVLSLLADLSQGEGG